MTLPTNPTSKIFRTPGQASSTGSNAAGNADTGIGNFYGKAKLDSKINRLSGGVGSGYSGNTANFRDIVNNKTALGGIGNPIQTNVIGTTTFSETVGRVAKTAQDIAGKISNNASDISGALNKLTGGSLSGGLAGIATKISAATGTLSNVLGIFGGPAIPPGGELFVKQDSAIQLSPGSENDWRVRITCDWEIFNSPLFKPLESTGGVVFPYLPNISVTSKANYNTPDSIHTNYPFHAYKNSLIEDITIAGEFTAENELEAAYWISATTFFKTATKMFFGQGEYAGSPPIICNLTGYGSSVFDKIPVVITTFTVDLKDDTNYIRCNTFGTNTWVPAVSSVSVTVKPIYNRRRLRQFSLVEYAKGEMVSGEGVGYI